MMDCSHQLSLFQFDFLRSPRADFRMARQTPATSRGEVESAYRRLDARNDHSFEPFGGVRGGCERSSHRAARDLLARLHASCWRFSWAGGVIEPGTFAYRKP